MSWRLVVVSSPAKLSYKNDFLVIRSEELKTVHLSEISVLMIETNTYNMTGMLISELSKRNIVVITCNEKRIPTCLMVPIYGHHKTSYRLQKQMHWNYHRKNKAWKQIIRNKIKMQAQNLKEISPTFSKELFSLIKKVGDGDCYNMEAQAARKYFKPLFGSGFSRNPQKDCGINQCLNYAYAILLSMTVRSILSFGYITELGIFHHNRFNNFNLASDLMEPFRPLADLQVHSLQEKSLTPKNKKIIAEMINKKVIIQGKKYYLNNAVHLYVKSVLKYLNGEVNEILEIGGFICDL